MEGKTPFGGVNTPPIVKGLGGLTRVFSLPEHLWQGAEGCEHVGQEEQQLDLPLTLQPVLHRAHHSAAPIHDIRN